MGIYGNPKLLQWFQDEYSKRVPTKLNMGKSCIRFTNTKNIPFKLNREFVTRMSMQKWIECYEAQKK